MIIATSMVVKLMKIQPWAQVSAGHVTRVKAAGGKFVSLNLL